MRYWEKSATTTQLVFNKINNNEDIFRLKPKLRKGSTKNINVNHLKCESRECTNTNVDLIKCNICLKWVCEDCHDVAINKLQPIMSKCKTIYFICKECDETTQGANNKAESTAQIVTTNKTEEKIVESIQTSLDKAILQLEYKLENLIESKLDEKMHAITTFNDSIKEQNATIHKISQSYSDSVKRTFPTAERNMDFRQIIRDTKNEELVQIREREARENNIIHGFPEASEGPVGNNEDIQTIKELLNVIEVEAIPVSTTRIGKQNDAKPRPIKIKMRNLNEKEMVMSNLGKLKHAPEKFGRTSL